MHQSGAAADAAPLYFFKGRASVACGVIKKHHLRRFGLPSDYLHQPIDENTKAE
jgi:hypothetical protein